MKCREEILRSEKVYQGKLLTLKKNYYRTANGRESAFDVVEHRGAVVVVAVFSDESLLFVKQWRRAVQEELLELVAGTLEEGEEPLECAKRELAEEAGLQASQWAPLGKLFPTPGFCTEIQHGFLAKELTPCCGTPDEDEILAPVQMSKIETNQMIVSGAICDAKTLAFLFRAREMGVL